MRAKTSKKKILVFSLMSILIALMAIFGWWLHARSSQPDYVAGKCSDYYTGLYDNFGLGPESIKAMANEYSDVIVTATVEDPGLLKSSMRLDDPAPRIKVTDVIKSNGKIKKGDTITVCQGLGEIKLSKGEHPEVLVFIENKDGDRWVPTLGYLGIAPRIKDGQFRLSGIATDGPKVISLDELQNIVK